MPASVGRGACFQGLPVLRFMQNACASGVSAVNSDNGFGEGDLASRIDHVDVNDAKRRI